MLEERTGLNWASLGYDPLDLDFRQLASPDADTRAAASQRLFDSKVLDDTRYVVRSYVVVRYIQLLANEHTDKYDLLATLAQLSRYDPALSPEDNHRVQSLLANNDAAFTPFLNIETLRDYALEIIGNLYHYADRFVPLLFTSFSHDDPYVIYTLARLIKPDVPHLEVYTEFFQANLTSPDTGIRAHAALALAKLLGPSAPPAVDTILLHSVFYRSVDALVDGVIPLGQERAVAALLKKLEDERDRDRLFTLVLYLLLWHFEGFPSPFHFAIVPAFFHPRAEQEQGTLAITWLLMRGWLLDKFPSLRKTVFQTSNAVARYIYFVDTSEAASTDSAVSPRTHLTAPQRDLLQNLLNHPAIWQYETNIFALFGLPQTQAELKRLITAQKTHSAE